MSDDFAELKKLFPTLSPNDLVAAQERLDEYLLLAWEIWEDSQMRGDYEDSSGFPNSQN